MCVCVCVCLATILSCDSFLPDASELVGCSQCVCAHIFICYTVCTPLLMFQQAGDVCVCVCVCVFVCVYILSMWLSAHSCSTLGLFLCLQVCIQLVECRASKRTLTSNQITTTPATTSPLSPATHASHTPLKCQLDQRQTLKKDSVSF